MTYTSTHRRSHTNIWRPLHTTLNIKGHTKIRSHFLFDARTKTCLESELKKKALHLEWEREADKMRRRKEEVDMELQRQVEIKEGCN